MPRQSHRRELLGSAVIQVLAQRGAGGLTHRAVDAQADVPVGTTSRYFRTREALLVAAAETVRDRHRAYLEQLVLDASGRDADLAGALAGLIAGAESANRDLYLARAELALESLRRPGLLPILAEVRTASIRTAQRLAHGAGVELTEHQVDLLGSLLWGIAHDRITLGRPELAVESISEAVARAVGGPTVPRHVRTAWRVAGSTRSPASQAARSNTSQGLPGEL